MSHKPVRLALAGWLGVVVAGGADADPNDRRAQLAELDAIAGQLAGVAHTLDAERAHLAQIKKAAPFAQTLAPGDCAVEITLPELPRAMMRIASCRYRIDGIEVAALTGDDCERPLTRGALEPGPHALIVELVYRAESIAGFPYLKAYRYTATVARIFDAAPGRTTLVGIKAVLATADDQHGRPQ